MKNNIVTEFEELLVNLKELMDNIAEHSKELSKEQGMCDRELSDLQHYTEFLDVDDKEAIVIFKEIKKTITRRREIKNTLSQIDSLHGVFSDKIGGTEGVQEVLNKFDDNNVRLAERKYKPRIRVDLFEKLHR